MKTVLGLFICFGLAALGSSLECEVCSEFGTSCSGGTMPCEADKDTCIITASYNSLVGVPLRTIAKGCGTLDTCRHGLKYMNLGQGKTIRSSSTCCVGEDCQTRTSQVPPAITEPNGKRCQACYATTTTSCPDETVDCHGPEDHCLDMAVRVVYGSLVVNTAQKGCVSKSVCDDLKKGVTDFTGGSVEVLKAACRPAGIKA
ncbi:phospholipase A2 inhibitor gamma subunit B-like [Heteronotia binoei]|uniref:phospholipase A2 inhibitor gamma subunit B-like n=1 Tax=Heteronotia binoei TaxID=13085 RepID=UPI0029318499|nr:phospholipase A2 inhibitor gamma subunit B-like [Heteronotia binoei]